MSPTYLSRAVCAALASSTLLLASASALATTISDTLTKSVSHGAKAVSIANPAHFDGDLRQLPPAKKWLPGDPVKVANPRHIRDIQTILPAVNPVVGEDPLVAKQLAASKKKGRKGRNLVTEINIDGLGFNGVNPPDTTGDIGLKYYIQSINSPEGSAFNVYDKSDGALVAGPLNMASLQSGDCANSMGDPIVLFDEQAKRWLLTEFSTPGANKLCVLVSKTEDPVSGGWYAYEFQAPSFPDYPKYSQIGGVYYASANENQSAVYAFERAKMLKGEPAAMIRQEVPVLAGFGFNSITPIDVDGEQDAPEGTPGLFIRHRDDELHNAGANNAQKDYLELWHLTPDFNNPDNTKLEGPFNIAMSEIDSNFTCNGPGYGCLEQAEDAQTLDPLREVVMYKGQYRRFSGHESIVGNLITKVGVNTAAVRWFELRRSGESDWALYQEGTYTEADGNNRYMGGVAMDGDGNLALAYMTTGPSRYPSIAFNGRHHSDEAGTLTFGEQLLIEGTSPISSDRDGDYSQMGVDPVDNCTFWFTSEYGKQDGRWGTRVSSFKMPSCGDPNPGFTLSATNLTQEVCVKGELQPITINASGYNAFAGNIRLSYGTLAEGLSGSFSADTFKPGVATHANMSVAEGTAFGEYSIEIKGVSDGALERSLVAKLKLMDKVSEVAPQSPANNAEQVSLQPTLSWSDDNRAASYWVEIASDESFGNIVASAEVVGGNSYRPSQPLAQSTQYYWRVKALNSCGENGSEVAKFTTKNEKEGATALSKSVATAAFSLATEQAASFYIDVPEGASDLSFTLSANNGDADLYVAKELRPESGGTVICASESSSSNESCVFEGDVASGTYFATVYAYDGFSNAKLLATYKGGSIIEGQVPLTVDEEAALEIKLADLTVADENYPNGYTLTVLPGDKYTVANNVITPVTDFVGELSVALRVFSATVDSGVYNLKVTVNNVNDAPVIEAITDAEMLEDSSFSVTLDRLSVSDVDNADPADFSVIVVAGSHYSVEGSHVVKPAANFSGTLSVQVKVSDGELSSEVKSFNLVVTPVNDAPVLVDDSFSVDKGSSNNLLDVLSNDIEVDSGDSLTLVSVEGGNGSVSVSGNKLSYTAAADFSGQDSFSYTAKDNAGEQRSATVTVTVKQKTSTNSGKSGGGSVPLLMLLCLLPLALQRRFK